MGVNFMVRLTLNEYLDEQKITRYELAKRSGIRFQIIDNYYKNRVVRYDSDVLDRICTALGCELGDIISYQKDTQGVLQKSPDQRPAPRDF